MYFHLPPLGGDRRCVYGVSCYRQIEAKVGHNHIHITQMCPQSSRLSAWFHLQALKVRRADVTRETVQKSVCVLSRVVRGSFALVLESLSWFLAHPVLLQPLYGLLQAKLQLITHAYFEEKDFSQISILKVRVLPRFLLSAGLRLHG